MHLQECVDAAGSIAAACRAADTAAYSLDTSSTLSIHRSSKRAHDQPPAQWHVSRLEKRKTEAEWFTEDKRKAESFTAT